ncbi:MAG: DUF305 domain-containing protein [Acidimicrobiia bacterium]|nr:DUF305 domain-containing protein [Acidimicrobiia bacterium]
MFVGHQPPAHRFGRRVVLAAAALVGVAACGSDNDDGAGSNSSAAAVDQDFNNADVQFARDMIPHHERAVEMAVIAIDPSVEAGQEVQDLATRIEDAQDPEIDLMSGWLTAWGQGPSGSGVTAGTDDADGMDMDDDMMTGEEMSSLAELRGDEFDQQWMDMMIRHHQGAIAMAETELDDGSNADAVGLAERIIEAQEAEIDEMRTLLDS